MLSLVIVGAAGDLGTAVAQAARARGWQTVCLTREHLDLARPETVADGLRPHRFDALVNCAAYHRVDECQRELMRAYNVNALAVEQIAIACASECVPFVTVSTDYVSDGGRGEPYVEADAPNPLSMYGLSKWVGERQAQRAFGGTRVIRTSALFGGAGRSSKGGDFVRRVMEKARRGEKIEVPGDVRFAPTYILDLGAAVLDALEDKRAGVVHLAGGGETSWAELAQEALSLAGLRHMVCPVSAAEREAQGAARRPRHSVLRSERWPGGASLPDYRIGLREYVGRVVGEWRTTVRIVNEATAP